MTRKINKFGAMYPQISPLFSPGFLFWGNGIILKKSLDHNRSPWANYQGQKFAFEKQNIFFEDKINKN